MKKLFCILLSICMVLGLCACTKVTLDQDEGTAQPLAAVTPIYPDPIDFNDYEGLHNNRDANPVAAETVSAINNFACAISAQLLNTGDNACCSPLSLYYALALAAVGAGGETQSELLRLLGFDSAEELAQQCGNLYRQVYTDNGVSQLKIANSLWLDTNLEGQTVTFHQNYLDTAAQDFYASVYQAEFGSEATNRAMGQWVADNTSGKLQPEFQTDSEMILSILNTVYFHDEWTSEFNKDRTESAEFHLAGGGTVTTDFMNSGSLGGFCRGENFTRAGLALKSSGAMYFILPDEGVDVYALLSNSEALEEALFGGEECYGEITWSIPKFSYDSEFEPMEALKALGVTSAFAAQTADFSGITDLDCWISQVEHGTHIAIDEKGVEAAAYTELGYAGAGMPQDQAEMILDRPFLYAVTDYQGNLLFVGVCADPTAD